MSKQTEEIKFRVDAMLKRELLQLAEQEFLALSDIVRRACREMVRRQIQTREANAKAG